MSGSKQSAIQTRDVLPAVLVGAVLSVASAIAYSNSGQSVSSATQIIISAIALPIVPGYVLSAYISGNIHDANLILAGVINFILYGGLTLWLLTWRSRRKLVA